MKILCENMEFMKNNHEMKLYCWHDGSFGEILLRS